MNRLLKIIFLIALPIAAQSETYKSTNTIQRLGSIDSRENADFIILNSFRVAGSCPLASDNLVVARFKSGEIGNRSYSMALAARISGKRVSIAVDDTDKNSEGQCNLRSIEIID